MGSNESIKQGVMVGLGISFISANTIVAEAEEERLTVLDVKRYSDIGIWRLFKRKNYFQPALLFGNFSRKAVGTFFQSSKALNLA